MAQDSGYCSGSEIDYMAEVDRALNMFEAMSKDEKYFLLKSSFKVPKTTFELGCGLSPARSFSPVIILKQTNQQLIFSTYEWAEMMDVFHDLLTDFFSCQDTRNGEVHPPIKCGEFVHISKLIYDENIKQLMVMKHLRVLYLMQEDVMEIIRMDSGLLSAQVNFLEDLNFCMYFHNVLDNIRNMLPSTKLSVLELLDNVSKCTSHNVLHGNALREYLYFYKEKIVNDFNK